MQEPTPHHTHSYNHTAMNKQCGHVRHVGTCAYCQRAQLSRWRVQLAQAQAPGYGERR